MVMSEEKNKAEKGTRRIVVSVVILDKVITDGLAEVISEWELREVMGKPFRYLKEEHPKHREE